MLIPYLSYILFAYSFFARLLNWLSIWQQKEYRLDRFFAFLKTPAGRAQIFKLVNFPLSKSALRRPKFTKKALLIFILVVCLLLFFTPATVPAVTGFYLLLPVIVIFATLPAWLITRLVTHYYQSKSSSLIKHRQPTIIGITGSYGKTTTKLLLDHLLQAKFKVWSSPKSHNTPFSLPRAFASTYQGQPYVIIEFAAYKIGEIAALTKIFPSNIAVLTGLAPQHLSLFGSWQNLLKAKSELPSALKDGAKFIYNSSDQASTDLVKPFDKLHLMPSIKATLSRPCLDDQGRLSFNLGQAKINTNLIGLHYFENLKLAVTLAKDLGLTPRQIKSQLESFSPPEQFIRLLKRGNTTIIDDTGTTNPQGFLAGVDMANHLKASHKIIITPGIIDLGSQSAKLHRQLAQKSRTVFDLFLHTDTTEGPALQSVLKSKYHAVTDLAGFKHLLSSRLNQDALILIEGRIKPEYLNYLLNL